MLTFIFEQLLNSAETDGQAIRAIRTLYDLRLAQSPIFQKRKHGPALQLNRQLMIELSTGTETIR